MDRSDIDSILAFTKTQIEEAEKQSKQGKIDPVLVKNIMENLRSTLDYVASTLAADLQKRNSPIKVKKDIYFPYGAREQHFINMVNRSFPGLSQYEPEIFALLRSKQKFECGDAWLIDLCSITNEMKHSRLAKHEEKSHLVVDQGGIRMKAQQGVSVHMYGNTVNGVLQDNVTVMPDGNFQFERHSGSTLIFRETSINFSGKNIEILPFLKNCYSNISRTVDQMEHLLEKANAPQVPGRRGELNQ